MCSHEYFHQGNAKQTRTTLKNFCKATFIRSAVYVSYIVPSAEPRFFPRETGGAFLKGALITNFKP